MDFEIEGKWEPLSKNYRVFVTKAHTFTTDTILLANFAAPKSKDTCADFGTGCGMIPLIWKSKFSPKSIVGIEIQDQAAWQAQKSVSENGFSNTIKILHADAKDIKKIAKHAEFSLIACNPPYKALGAGIKNSEENRTLARHEESFSLEDLAKSAAFSLKFGGRLCICQRPERLADAMAIFRANGLEPKRLRLVQQREEKAPFLFLLESKRGGAVGMQIEPTLIIEDEKGLPSAEINEIYGEYREGANFSDREEI